MGRAEAKDPRQAAPSTMAAAAGRSTAHSCAAGIGRANPRRRADMTAAELDDALLVLSAATAGYVAAWSP